MNLTTTQSNGSSRDKEREHLAADISRKACPYLGLKDDDSAWLAFPAEGNSCHYAQPVRTTALEHQEWVFDQVVSIEGDTGELPEVVAPLPQSAEPGLTTTTPTP